MKTLAKQIMQAFFMGVVVPGLVLGSVIRFDTGGREMPLETEQTTSATLETTQHIQITGKIIPVLQENNEIINMELEEYLCGVVLAEMPADFEIEAMKAQAVVARTYALRRYESGTKHPQGAICTNPSCCQGYLSQEAFLEKGGEQAGIFKVRSAVLETAGQVITYDGELIEATYFSCSGGTTEDALAVWGNDVPYLRSTDSPGEEEAVHYTDTVTFTPEDVESALGVQFTGGPEEWFGMVTRTNGGGVAQMEIAGRIFTGVELRALLNLRSTDFTVEASENAVTIVTRGFGHRVGMSQYGADAMAVSGSGYEEILTHYYQGTVLEQYPAA